MTTTATAPAALKVYGYTGARDGFTATSDSPAGDLSSAKNPLLFDAETTTAHPLGQIAVARG